MIRLRLSLAVAALFLLLGTLQADPLPGRWTVAQAQAWSKAHPWYAGGNFLPSDAINQLEMWQAATFNPALIDRDLGYAEGLGFRSMRVFLHDLAWREDPVGFLKRLDQYLAIANRHHLSTLFVLFDSCWDPFPHVGQQHEPKPHVHNSGWVQSPGAKILADDVAQDQLEGYVKAVLQRFRDDSRIVGWDLYNEPDNENASSYGKVEIADKAVQADRLLLLTFKWAREVHPTQPLTSAPWKGDLDLKGEPSETTRIQLENSDVISFHCYKPATETREWIQTLEKLSRPVMCSEYMARPVGSRFETILPIFKAANIPAYNWGFVAGKSQTNYPWDSWQKAYSAEPPEWFHDVVRPDGTPYRDSEAKFLRSILEAPSR